MKTGIKIVLSVVVLVLGYFVWDSINQPIRFQTELEQRKAKVVNQLIAVRNAQVAYKSVNNQYTGNFDTLISFIKTGKLLFVKMEGRLTDSMLSAGVTEIDALKSGIIKRDTFWVNVIDSIVKDTYVIDSLPFVPMGNGVKIDLNAGFINTASNFKVPVFEAKVPYEVFLSDMDKQEVINLKAVAYKLERYPGVKVGSMSETNNNAGNWE